MLFFCIINSESANIGLHCILIVITLSCDHVLIRLPKLKLQQLLSIHQAP